MNKEWEEGMKPQHGIGAHYPTVEKMKKDKKKVGRPKKTEIKKEFEKLQNNLLEQNIKINELDNCLYKKDRRLKKLERYFEIRAKIFWSICVSFVCFAPLIIIVLIENNNPCIGFHNYPFLAQIFIAIGAFVTLVGLLVFWSLGIIYIWDKEAFKK